MSKRVLITGATSGIGKALAAELAGRGYDLGLAARRIETLNAMQTELSAAYPSVNICVRQLDVTDYDNVPAAFHEIAAALGGVDIVVANAGIGLGEKVGAGRFDAGRRTVEVNLIGAMATVDAAVAYFLERGRGHIVGTASVAAFRGMPRGASYCASKAGLAIYLEALRAELYGRGIDITVLYPGYIDTPLNDMLPNRPFLISVEKGAAIIAGLIEKRVKSSTVPVFPWNIVGRLLKMLPTAVIAKM
jgi:short-subunit dehydrogenase